MPKSRKKPMSNNSSSMPMEPMMNDVPAMPMNSMMNDMPHKKKQKKGKK